MIIVPPYRRCSASTTSSAAATLSSPIPSGTLGASTTASLGVTTNQASGTVYAVVDTTANLVGISAAQIKAGQNKDSAAAVSSGSGSALNTTPTVTVSGLSAATAYGYAIVQNNANGDSNIATGTFTTASVGTFDYYIGSSGSDSNDGSIGSPWALTALTTKSATYAGKRLGILDGTYDVHAAWIAAGSTQNDYSPLFVLPAGTASNPTVIKAVNARQAILNGKSGGGARMRRPMMGREAAQSGSSYIEIRDLDLRGCGSNGCISFYGTSATPGAPGIIIDGCVISDMLRAYGVSADNCCGVWLSGITSAQITNCEMFDITNPSGTHNACGVLLYGSQNTLIEKCTMYNMPAGVFDKQKSFYSLPNIGTVCRFNYFYSIQNPIYGFSNGGGSAYPYSPYYIHNNVIESCAEPFMTEYGTLSIKSIVYFYNNTIIANVSNASGYATVWLMSVTTGRAYYYNNIMNSTHASPGYQGRLVFSPGGWAVSDFNTYGPSFDVGLTPGSDNNGSTTNYTSLASWKATAGGPDANSHSQTAMGFTGTGTGPERYKLDSGSISYNAGKTGGTSGGDTVHRGAYSSSGQTEQIGAAH